MADRTSDAHRFAREQQRRITSATAIGFNAVKPIIGFQVSMLRLWADSIEKFAGNSEEGLERAAKSAVEEQQERAA
jgi:hypothetical protein